MPPGTRCAPEMSSNLEGSVAQRGALGTSGGPYLGLGHAYRVGQTPDTPPNPHRGRGLEAGTWRTLWDME